MGLDDFLDFFNLAGKANGLFGRIITAMPKHVGIKEPELVIGEGMWGIRINNQNNCGGETERLLARFGIRIWERRVRTKEHLFIVAEHNANWAEYLINRYGIAFSDSYRPYNLNNFKNMRSDEMITWADKRGRK